MDEQEQGLHMDAVAKAHGINIMSEKSAVGAVEVSHHPCAPLAGFIDIP